MTTRNIARIACPIAFLLLAASLTGCGGPSTAEVSGKITFKGQPPRIEGLGISFMGTDGRPVTVSVAEDGSYSASNVQTGNVWVGFSVAKMTPTTDPPSDGEPKEKPKQAKPPAKPTGAEKVLEKYLDPLRSGVTTTLNPGHNTFDYDIK